MRRILLVLASTWLACGGGGGDDPLPPTDPADLLATLEDLADLGEKRIATPAGAAAGDYLHDRMDEIGLDDVHFEGFRIPAQSVLGSSLAVTVDGVPLDPAPVHEVFYGSSSGTVDGELVYVNYARPADLDGLDLTGKIALVRRNANYHRSSQYRNLIEAGAVAMLYVSAAGDNLIQVGTVTDGWAPEGTIPAVTIGSDDGDALRSALGDGQAVAVAIAVDTEVADGGGRNVIGRIEGREAGEIVIGAHYDTWFTGSVDNGSGVAAVLALADRRARKARPRYSLVFVAYDGEEIALYGGYHYLREHHVVHADPLLAVINFEMPAATEASLLGLGRSAQPVLDDALHAGGLNFVYPAYVTLDVVPDIFGGIIPTDIQGLYRAGVPTVTTATDSPYYHTTADTPDKVDLEMLAGAVDGFDQAVDELLRHDPGEFAGADPALWQLAASVQGEPAAGPLRVEVTVRDAAGAVQADAAVSGSLLYDDFWFASAAAATTDADGRVTLEFDTDAAPAGSGARFVHLAAGREWPLVEAMLPVD